DLAICASIVLAEECCSRPPTPGYRCHLCPIADFEGPSAVEPVELRISGARRRPQQRDGRGEGQSSLPDAPGGVDCRLSSSSLGGLRWSEPQAYCARLQHHHAGG